MLHTHEPRKYNASSAEGCYCQPHCVPRPSIISFATTERSLACLELQFGATANKQQFADIVMADGAKPLGIDSCAWERVVSTSNCEQDAFSKHTKY